MLKKGILFILIVLGGLCSGTAQDIIQKTTGEEIRCRIADVSPGVVKYRVDGQADGPVFSISVEQIAKIIYGSGKTITYEHEQDPDPSQTNIPEPEKASNTFGWHLGLGTSNITGDIEGNKWLMASSVGVSFILALGPQNSVLLGADVLSTGCGLEDLSAFDEDSKSYIEISDWEQNMSYLSLLAMYRQYFNPGRNYFAEGGVYGSFMTAAEWHGELAVTDSNGYYAQEAFQDDLSRFYNGYDYGLTAGVGGRIPMDKNGKWHLIAELRFYYGLANLVNEDYLIYMDYRESNVFGLFIIGVDLPTN